MKELTDKLIEELNDRPYKKHDISALMRKGYDVVPYLIDLLVDNDEHILKNEGFKRIEDSNKVYWAFETTAEDFIFEEISQNEYKLLPTRIYGG